MPRYLGYLRLLFEAMGSMPKVDNVLWRGVAADLHDTYEEGKVSPQWRGRAGREEGRGVGLQPRGRTATAAPHTPHTPHTPHAPHTPHPARTPRQSARR